MINRKNSYHNLLLIASILLVAIPPALISGPFLPDLFIVLISIIFLFIYKFDKDFLYRSLFFKIFLIFNCYIVLISVFSEYAAYSIRPSFTYIRFGIFTLAIIFILKNNEIIKKFFYYVLCLTIGILLIDGFFQFFTGKNFFGYETIRPDRLSGLFFDELILGSYLGKILPIFCFFSIYNKNYVNKYYVLTIILLTYLLIFLSGERSAFLTTTLYLILISPFFFNLKKGIIFFAIISLSFGILITTNKNIKNRYFDQLIAHTIPNYEQHGINKFLPEHRELFISAIKIFKENIFFGGGVKTFRIYCKEFDNRKREDPTGNISFDANKIKLTLKDVINTNDCKIYRSIKNCSNHPHNYYLQLLAETGFIGFIFVFFVFLKLLLNYFKQVYYLFKDKEKINKTNNIILSGLIVYLWPIITTGSFFNNWISSILFLQVGLYIYSKKLIDR